MSCQHLRHKMRKQLRLCKSKQRINEDATNLIRICKVCKESKHLIEFEKQNRWHRHICKVCSINYKRERYRIKYSNLINRELKREDEHYRYPRYENSRRRRYASMKYKLKSRIRRHNRRVDEKSLTVEMIQIVYEENIIKYGALTCELCFKPIKFGEDSLEHFYPVSRKNEYQGKDINERSNLGVAHGNNSVERCNDKKGNKTLNEWFHMNEVLHQELARVKNVIF